MNRGSFQPYFINLNNRTDVRIEDIDDFNILFNQQNFTIVRKFVSNEDIVKGIVKITLTPEQTLKFYVGNCTIIADGILKNGTLFHTILAYEEVEDIYKDNADDLINGINDADNGKILGVVDGAAAMVNPEEYLKGGGTGADWNAKENENGYIKNKPFGTENADAVVLNKVNLSNIEDGGILLENADLAPVLDDDHLLMTIDGKEYNISITNVGTEYSLSPIDYDGQVNIFYSSDSKQLINGNNNDQIELSLIYRDEVVTTIDKKYIMPSIGYDIQFIDIDYNTFSDFVPDVWYNINNIDFRNIMSRNFICILRGINSNKSMVYFQVPLDKHCIFDNSNASGMYLSGLYLLKRCYNDDDGEFTSDDFEAELIQIFLSEEMDGYGKIRVLPVALPIIKQL